MRTTIDLPEDLHRLLTSVAHDRRQSLSQTAASILRDSLLPDRPVEIEREGPGGLPLVRVGRVVTVDDVRSLDDER
jgi:hypothetical protein